MSVDNWRRLRLVSLCSSRHASGVHASLNGCVAEAEEISIHVSRDSWDWCSPGEQFTLEGAVRIGVAIFCGLLSAHAQKASDPVAQGFADPPNSARPRVWWHWMNGNISQEGIKLDLDWMHRIGVGGFHVFEGSINTPLVVPKRLVYMTPEWRDAFRLAITTGQQMGMEMTIASSPGWSETGGPWVPPAQAMKKMVWSETRVEGMQAFHGKLPMPPAVAGLFQNSTAHFETNREDSSEAPSATYYADSAVIAYRIPADDHPASDLGAKITSSGGVLHAAELSDGDVDTVALALPFLSADQSSWVQFAFPQPQAIQSLTLATKHDLIRVFTFDDKKVPHPQLEASDDGVHFRHVADISYSSVTERTISFTTVTARFFRVTFPAYVQPPQHAADRHQTDITELVLNSTSRVNEVEKKAGFATVQNYYDLPAEPASTGSVVSPGDVIDLTARMDQDGNLKWDIPAGNWSILRIGYSLTGHRNGPAPPEATGLEVDKLNPHFVKNYLDTYFDSYQQTVGASLMGRPASPIC